MVYRDSRQYENNHRPSYGAPTMRGAAPHKPPSSHCPEPFHYDGPDDPNRHSHSPSPTPSTAPNTRYFWPLPTSTLIKRTTRAYTLIQTYSHDSHGGQRWYPDDITRICHIGRDLHAEVRALYQQRNRELSRGADAVLDLAAVKSMAKSAQRLHEYCERIQRAIAECENVPASQLLATGRYAQDEHGVLYKVSDQEDMADEAENGAAGKDVKCYAKSKVYADRNSGGDADKPRQRFRSRAPSPQVGRYREERQDRDRGYSRSPDRSPRRGFAGRLGKHVLHY